MSKERYQGLNKSETLILKLIKQEVHMKRINPGRSKPDFTLDQALKHNNRLRNYERSVKLVRRLTDQLSIQNRDLFRAWSLLTNKPDLESLEFRFRLLNDPDLRNSIQIVDRLKQKIVKKG